MNSTIKPTLNLYGVIAVKNVLFLTAIFQTMSGLSRYESNSDHILIIALWWAVYSTTKYFFELPIWLVLIDKKSFNTAFQEGMLLNEEFRPIRMRGLLYDIGLGLIFILSVFGLLLMYVNKHDTVLLFSSISVVAYILLKLLLNQLQNIAIIIKLKRINLDVKSIYRIINTFPLKKLLITHLKMIPNVLLSITTLGLLEPHLSQKRKIRLIDDVINVLEKDVDK